MARYNTLAYQLGGVPPSCLSGGQGRALFVKPYSGVANNTGKSPTVAKKTCQAAHDAATTGNNDVVYLLSESATASTTTDYYLSAAPLVWSKNSVHLIGQNAGNRFSLRSRIAWNNSTSASADTVLATFSGSNCRVENIQFITGVADANLAFNVLVSGSMNVFKNCHFAGIANATLDATGAYSLKVSGAENVFEDCVIGVDTIIRTGANNELWVTNGRNIFKNCLIVSYSETAGRCAVKIDNTSGDIRYTYFENCKFINYTTNLATGNTNVFDMPASGSTCYVYLDSNCNAFGGGAAGIGAAWADTDTSIFVAAPIPNTAGGKALAAT